MLLGLAENFAVLTICSHFSERPDLLGLWQEGKDVDRCERVEEKKEAGVYASIFIQSHQCYK